MTTPPKPYDPKIEINDVLHETALRRVDFDKGCAGAKYQVFARNDVHAPWRHVAEATTEQEALEISADDERCFGAEMLTEVDRRRANALRQLVEENQASGAYDPEPLNEASLERLSKQLNDLQDKGFPFTLHPKKVKIVDTSHSAKKPRTPH